jgi:hypothetical protein
MQTILKKLLPSDMLYEISKYIAYPDIKKLANIHIGTNRLIQEREMRHTKENRIKLNDEYKIKIRKYSLFLLKVPKRKNLRVSEQRAKRMYVGKYMEESECNIFNPYFGFECFEEPHTCCGEWKYRGCGDCIACGNERSILNFKIF